LFVSKRAALGDDGGYNLFSINDAINDVSTISAFESIEVALLVFAERSDLQWTTHVVRIDAKVGLEPVGADLFERAKSARYVVGKYVYTVASVRRRGADDMAARNGPARGVRVDGDRER
jgi:hypothetical protein